jgi:ABC-type oligopeptide transport system ATPase subunit
MFRGTFENCYGIRKLELKQIDYSDSNRALIYAPNGVMKTSFANSIANICIGNHPCDELFKNRETQYYIKYKEIEVSKTSTSEELSDFRAHVIKSFDDVYQSGNIATLLVNTDLRTRYEEIMEILNGQIKKLQIELNKKSKLSKPKIKDIIVEDFGFNTDFEWVETIIGLTSEIEGNLLDDNLCDISYSSLINSKTLTLLKDPIFYSKINKYNQIFDALLKQSELLGNNFDDNNANELTKAIGKINLFKENHVIELSDGQKIKSLDEWKERINDEFKVIEQNEELNKIFKDIGGMLNSNSETRALKKIISDNKVLVGYFANISKLKKSLWINYFLEMHDLFGDIVEEVKKYQEELSGIILTATSELDIWKKVIDEYNNRFSVPFQMLIENQSNMILKNESPNIIFEYKSGDESVKKTQNELMQVLSMGEKRALYLLHTLFDIEMIKKNAIESQSHFLIVADDIADSFDYKNKYAIIEYLNDIAQCEYIDLLILTHNFDFYRTVASRLDVKHSHSFMVQKDTDENLKMMKCGYHKDVFKVAVVNSLKNGQVCNVEKKKKWLIAAIPFVRNIASYKGDTDVENFMTNLLHRKEGSAQITIDELWANYINVLNFNELKIESSQTTVIGMLDELCSKISSSPVEGIDLENKLLLSIGVRLKAEEFMENKHTELNIPLPTSTSNQTREWFNSIKDHIDEDDIKMLEQVNLLTPENIHVNAFMYEPIIDLSDWHLIKLYLKLLERLNSN